MNDPTTQVKEAPMSGCSAILIAIFVVPVLAQLGDMLVVLVCVVAGLGVYRGCALLYTCYREWAEERAAVKVVPVIEPKAKPRKRMVRKK